MAITTDTVEDLFFNANRLNQRFVFTRDGYDSFSISSRLQSGEVGSAALTLERSFDGGASWVAMNPALTLDPDGTPTRELDFDAPLISVRVSAAAGAACRLHITANRTKDL